MMVARGESPAFIATPTMTASDWHNILRCARLRKEQFGTSLRWPSMADYYRYQREYDTYIMAGAMAARARRHPA